MSNRGENSDGTVNPGWYPDVKRPGIEMYWDGKAWSKDIAPRAVVKREPVWKQARVITLGILMAIAVVFVVVKLSQPSDAECSLQRLEYMTGDREIYDVDDACRS